MQNAAAKIQQNKLMRVARFVDTPAILYAFREVNCRRDVR